MPRKTDKPNSAQLQAYRKYLRDAGMSNQDAQRLVKSTMTFEQISLDIAADLRGRPKGVVVPKVTVMGVTMPISSRFTYEKIILPIQRALS